jgi:hypothetical protein
MSTITFREWQEKSVSLVRGGDDEASRNWEFHCGKCLAQEKFELEQGALDALAGHNC